MVATIVQIGVLVMMNTHLYNFNGYTFLQCEGGPIGLRATCAVARVVMNEWDARWMNLMKVNNITIMDGERYMDDVRAILKALKPGWRWWDGGLHFCQDWKAEDLKAGKSGTRRTAEALLDSMNEIMDFLEFTKEIHEDFPNGKLPTLDTEIYVVDGKWIRFEFFQKPMASNLVLQSDSALSNTVKIASLKEEVVRRLKHTSVELPHTIRMETLEDLTQKMINSGHKPAFIKSILIGGILRYEAKLKNSLLNEKDPEFRPLHQPSGRNNSRLKKKAMARSQWFKDKNKQPDDDQHECSGRGKPSKKAGNKLKSIEGSKEAVKRRV